MNSMILKLAVVFSSLLLVNNVSFFDKTSSGPDDYKQMWDKVSAFEQNALPKSALEQVEEIYALALKEKNDEQIIKSTIYRMKYISTLEEDGYVIAINKLEAEVQTLEGVSKAMLHMLLANMYAQYLSSNYYLISQRSVTFDFKSTDLMTWDESKFKDKIIKNFMLALDDKLKDVSIREYAEVIGYAKNAAGLFPTLYDFVAYSALNILSGNYNYNYYYYQYGSQKNDVVSEPAYLANVNQFVKLPVKADSLSYHYASIQIYQKWLDVRLSDKDNLEALLYTDIMRLNFLKSVITSQNTDSLWESNLKNLYQENRAKPEMTIIAYELASYYNGLGNSYVFTDSTKLNYKTYNKKAITLLEEAITQYPDGFYYPECQNLKNEIENVNFGFEVGTVVTPNSLIPMRISYRNTDKVYMTVLTCTYEQYLGLDMYFYDDDSFANLLRKTKVVVNAKQIDLPKSDDYNSHSTEYLADGLDKGFYIIFLHATPKFELDKNYLAYSDVFVSNLSMVYNDNYNGYGNKGYYIVDKNSGNPVQSAKVEAYSYEYSYARSDYYYKKVATEYTDINGFVSLNKIDNDEYYDIRIDVSKGTDFISESTYQYGSYDYEDEETTSVKLFTDRAIYRPGQTINFKGICINQKGDKSKINTNYTSKVILYDVNSQEVSHITVHSNEYGSFYGSFDIPSGVLTGTFTLGCEYGNQQIRVEEYKRPQFEIEMLPIEGEYRINDSVFTEGKALTYAGTALTGTKVSYTITRNPLWWGYYRDGSFTSKEVDFGEVDIDDDGHFKIGFKAIAEDFGEMSQYVYYFYTINVSITDISGETQTSSSSVYVANKSLILSHDIYENVIKEQLDSLSINSANISGTFVPANVEVEIYKLKDPKLLLSQRNWATVDKKMYTKGEWYIKHPGYEYDDELNYAGWSTEKSVFKTFINTDNTKKIKLKGVENWESGVYRIVLKSKDKWGNAIDNVTEFVLFSEKDKEMPCVAGSFFINDAHNAQPGDTVSLFAGSSYKDVYVFYELEVKGKLFKKDIIKLSNGVAKVEIPITEEYRGGISANFMFVKNGQIYSSDNQIDVAWENKQLDLKFITFRDKTLPGSKEEWKVKITDNTGSPAGAEFLAAMYDASLDAFAQNSWYWSINPDYSSYTYWTGNSLTYNSSDQTYRNFYPPGVPKNRYLPYFNTFGMAYFIIYNSYDVDMSGMYEFDLCEKVCNTQSLSKSDNGILSFDGRVADEANMPVSTSKTTAIDIKDKEGTKSGESIGFRNQQSRINPGQDVQIRKNFNETAFFYPNLVTDEKGEILISFTMPESLTRWNFMGFAHTKDLKMGQISEEIVTQKELMVMPNLPRFFRENDKITLATKINNVSDVLIQGSATIEFFDPATLKTLNTEFLSGESNKQNISIESGKNIAVEWNITIPEGLSAVGVRFIAVGKNHSDGEEKIIPILTNRMLVTETMPLPVRKAGTTGFTMKKLKNNKSTTLKHQKYTLEFTNNPAWYAVQALPYIMEYPYECAEQTFSRYYANILATHIANSDPKIKRVFDIWKNTPSSDALLSNLEKNQDLKALLLEETPWVLEAQDENERKHRVGLLFDLNRMSNESSAALSKLEKQQKYNGGWAWFNGMPESWYITQYIVCGLGHLDNLGVTEIKGNAKTWTMTKNAIRFIDGELVKSYKDQKKYCDAKCMAEDHLGYMQIQYLYARSYFIKDIPIDENTKEAFDYYKGQAQKYWMNKGHYMQGMIALGLFRYEDKIVPAKIIASLKENAIHNDETGMYWKQDAGYYWYQAPIETHALLIEVFDEVANDRESVEEIKVWLLKQKQTQDWKTTKATAEAIYALLLRGTNLLSDDSMAQITIGDMKINPATDPDIKTEAGTGYFKKSWDGSQVNSSWGDVKVTKASNTVSWGAIYWQYFEQLDKITTFEETPLTINKKLFVERRVGVKPVIVPIEKDANLVVGDKVTVRIEIKVDRDMEYVHLKDMRASCFEPVDYLSGYRYKAGLGYYQGIKDASMNFFIDYLRKGTYVFEYELVVAQKGDFSNGITTMQSMYAPEFTSHSEGVRVSVK